MKENGEKTCHTEREKSEIKKVSLIWELTQIGFHD